jgi:hypothetical protein
MRNTGFLLQLRGSRCLYRPDDTAGPQASKLTHVTEAVTHTRTQVPTICKQKLWSTQLGGLCYTVQLSYHVQVSFCRTALVL